MSNNREENTNPEKELTESLETKVEEQKSTNEEWEKGFSIKILKPYEEMIRLLLGNTYDIKIPKLNISLRSSILKSGFPRIILPLIHQYKIFDKRIMEEDLPPQNIITKDNVEIGVDGIAYYKVVDTRQASLGVKDFKKSTIDFASSKLKEEIGKLSFDEVIRVQFNEEALGPYTKDSYRLLESFGTEIPKIMIKQVNIPDELHESMAKAKLAVEEARGKEELSKIEINIAKNLEEAAKTYKNNPEASRLRYLQTLEKASENKGTTILFPSPLESLLPK